MNFKSNQLIETAFFCFLLFTIHYKLFIALLLVPERGIEPRTSSLRVTCSTSWSYSGNLV